MQKRNQIEQLKDRGGNWQTWDTRLNQVISDYFGKLYTSQACAPNSVINLVPSWVMEEDNQLLEEPFTSDDIQKVVFSMGYLELVD